MEEHRDSKLEAIDEEFQQQQEMLEWKVEVGTLTEEEKNERLAILEQEREKSKAKIQNESNKKIEAQKKKNRDKENAKEIEMARRKT